MPIDLNAKRMWPLLPKLAWKYVPGGAELQTGLVPCTFRDAVSALAQYHVEHITSFDTFTVYQFIIAFEKLLLWCLSRRHDHDIPKKGPKKGQKKDPLLCNRCRATHGNPVEGYNACPDHGLSLLFDGLCRDGEIRAISYLSWEQREQIFQVRRTYPTDVGLVSYSVCYPEWGAVGEMLDELRRMPAGKRKQFPVNLFNIWEPGYQQRALPYLAEAAIHDFDHILVIPVFRPGENGYKKWQANQIAWFGDELLGLFLSFIKVPPPTAELESTISGPAFRKLMAHFGDRVASVLLEQELKFKLPRHSSLVSKWKSQMKESHIFGLVIAVREPCMRPAPTQPSDPPKLPLSSLAAFLIQALRGHWYSVVSEADTTGAGCIEFLVAPSKGLVTECAGDVDHLFRCLKSELDRGLRSIGLMREAVTYHCVMRSFTITVTKPR